MVRISAPLVRTSLLFLLAVTVGISAFGQSSMPTLLQGKVFDANRAGIPGASLTASRNGKSFTTTANRSGEFQLELEPGDYVLSISAEGFAQNSQTVTVDAATKLLEIELAVTATSATVTITDSAGYQPLAVSSATRTFTPLRDVPQSVTVVTKDVIRDQMMQSIGDVVRYVPGITAIQGENNRDQVVIRGNSSSADFFVDGVRDDVQYYRDLYNLETVEALKGPNAMTFGRGGGGGVINRVTKQAGFTSLRELTLQGGSYRNRRVAGDFQQALNDNVAFRLNGLYENSGSFRNRVGLERLGVNPNFTFLLGNRTEVRVGYEHFRDHRVADRGIPSYQGRPSDTDISTFFGDPDQSKVRARVDLLSSTFEHHWDKVILRNRSMFGDYDRFYQNFVPGAVSADKSRLTLTTYNNSTKRKNLFNQTDATFETKTGSIRHVILGGVELGHQVSDNFRNTGFFNNTTTSITVPFANPTISIPVTYRQSATDADNNVKANIAATYAQDQIEFSRYVQLLVGVRFDHFDLQFHNNRNGDDLQRVDNLVSPRVGLVVKPVQMLSLYSSYSVSYLPSSGDQFSSLTSVTQTLKPEKFTNYEVGAKWDLRPTLSMTAAAYQLNRTNTRATDPNDPTRIVQTGSQRTNGFEFGVNGSVTREWKMAGGYAFQDAYVTSATFAAPAGAIVAQVPRHTLSLWNNYRFLPKLGAGFGIIHRSDMFAAIDNRVVLPGYTRADAAIYFSFTEKIGMQANIENLFNKTYYINADSNDNITPGYPRALRVGLTARF
jgi:catecholate siderophore receptor